MRGAGGCGGNSRPRYEPHRNKGLAFRGGDKLQGFALSEDGKKFVWANATIEGDTVVVWNDAVPSPVAVSYAWAINPVGANLYNQAGLPAAPFRTDDWPRQ